MGPIKANLHALALAVSSLLLSAFVGYAAGYAFFIIWIAIGLLFYASRKKNIGFLSKANTSNLIYVYVLGWLYCLLLSTSLLIWREGSPVCAFHSIFHKSHYSSNCDISGCTCNWK